MLVSSLPKRSIAHTFHLQMSVLINQQDETINDIERIGGEVEHDTERG